MFAAVQEGKLTWAPIGCASCGRMKSTPITPTIRSSCSGGAATKPLTIWNTRLAASFGRCPSAFLASSPSTRGRSKRPLRKPQPYGSDTLGSMAGFATRYLIASLQIASVRFVIFGRSRLAPQRPRDPGAERGAHVWPGRTEDAAWRNSGAVRDHQPGAERRPDLQRRTDDT